jgi:CheY-like chemotaxis protein
MTSLHSPAQVLVVDDDRAIREIVAEILEEEACQVATAPHGAAALDYLKHTPSPPNVILLDLMMPIMDGITFLEAKQAEPILKEIPVVVLSANLVKRPEVLTLAVDAFLPKPVDYQLIAAIAQRYCHTKG